MPCRHSPSLLQRIISFRMADSQAAALLFGGIEGLPTDVTALKPGQFTCRDGTPPKWPQRKVP